MPHTSPSYMIYARVLGLERGSTHGMGDRQKRRRLGFWSTFDAHTRSVPTWRRSSPAFGVVVRCFVRIRTRRVRLAGGLLSLEGWRRLEPNTCVFSEISVSLLPA